MKPPKIIYFLLGALPTESELEEVAQLGVKVAYRNVQYIDVDHFPEECDGVAGLVPSNYSDKPSAVDALEEYHASAEARRKLVGDEPAPLQEAIKMMKPVITPVVKNPAIKPPKAGGWKGGK